MKNNKTNTAANKTNAKTTNNIPPVMGTAAPEIDMSTVNMEAVNALRQQVTDTIKLAANIGNISDSQDDVSMVNIGDGTGGTADDDLDIDGSSSPNEDNEDNEDNANKTNAKDGNDGSNAKDTAGDVKPPKEAKFSAAKIYRPDFGSQEQQMEIINKMKIKPVRLKAARVLPNHTPKAMYQVVPNEIQMALVKTTLIRYLEADIRIPTYQRSHVFPAAFTAGLAESAIKHRYIPPMTLIQRDTASGDVEYYLADGNQRTAALLQGRQSVDINNIPLFDSCPVYLAVVKCPPDMTEQELFLALNNNNKMSDAQKHKGDYIEDINKLQEIVSHSKLITALPAVKRKADVYSTERVPKLDDITTAITLASINRSKACSSTATIANTLKSMQSVSNFDSVAANMHRSCNILGEAIMQIAQIKEKSADGKSEVLACKKLVTRLSKLVGMIPIYVVIYTNPDITVTETISLIRHLYDNGGKARELPVVVTALTDTDEVADYYWSDIMDDTNRGNSVSSTCDRWRLACKIATVQLAIYREAERQRQELMQAVESMDATDITPDEL